MKIFTNKEARLHIDEVRRTQEFDRDNEGQLVLYTGLFEWKDGTIRDEPEEE